MFKAFTGTFIFSSAINILALGGPVFMLEVYDRVLPSKSIPTLVALLLMVTAVYAFSGFLDILRSRLVARIAGVVDAELAPNVFRLISEGSLRSRSGGDNLKASQDLDQIRGFVAGSGPLALMDLPWMPIYLVVCFLLHPLIGALTCAAMALLVMLTAIAGWATRPVTVVMAEALSRRNQLAEAARRNADAFHAMGMNERAERLWEDAHFRYTAAHRRSSDISTFFVGISKSVRFLIQSASLALGAYLVIMGEISAGSIIAGSVIVARTLAPIEQATATWRGMIAASQAWTRLQKQFRDTLEPDVDRTRLPVPTRDLVLEQVSVTAPGGGRPIIHNVSLTATAGNAIGVIGPSAAGKSTLLRAIAGVLPAAQGKVMLDGASLGFYRSEERGRSIGYLPQKPDLFPGTIAENIARLDPEASDEAVLAAAQAAGVHQMIVNLPDGYETVIGANGIQLSNGQEQRIALARALYGNPFVVVLDEPNSNLDTEGEAALAEAIAGIKLRGGIAVISSHRQAVMSHLDHILILENGHTRLFGPAADVMKLLKMERLSQPSPELAEPEKASRVSLSQFSTSASMGSAGRRA